VERLPAYPTTRAVCHLGLLEARQEHYTEAVASYRKAMALDPAMPRLQFNLALRIQSRRIQRALQQFNPLLKTEPPTSEEGQRLVILVACRTMAGRITAGLLLKHAAESDGQNLPLL